MNTPQITKLQDNDASKTDKDAKNDIFEFPRTIL